MSSRRFTLYRAFKQLWTWNPDVWFAAYHNALAAAGAPPRPFVPVDVDDAARIDRDAQAAEDSLDLGL